jgi:hypothetical protein
MSCSLLLIWSAGESAEHYSRGYLAELETHSPFRFAHLAEKRKKLDRWSGRLARLFESFLEDEECEPAPPYSSAPSCRAFDAATSVWALSVGRKH